MLPNSRVMIHQPWGGTQGTASDMEIQVNEILKLKKSLNQILAKHCGRPLEEVEVATDRDHFMSAAEALEFGIVDQVIGAE